MRQPRATRQRQLFDQTPTVPAVQLSPEVREQLRQTLVQWIKALANAIGAEGSDE